MKLSLITNVDDDPEDEEVFVFSTVLDICPYCKIENTLIIMDTIQLKNQNWRLKMVCINCNRKIIGDYDD